MNNGDKGCLTQLIKLIRPKKTKKQKLEEITLNPIICIGNYHIDKKIKEQEYMNWYKEAQKQNNWVITKLVSMFGTAAVLTLVSLHGMQGLASQYEANPQQIEQQAKQIQQQEEPAQVIEQPQFSNIPTEEPAIEEPVVEAPQAVNINLDKIWEIESSSGKDPDMKKPNGAGALGHFQFLRKTWDEMVGKMGQNWDWRTGALDYDKSKAVADFYLNKRIPSMLNYYDIPDTIETRLGSYNWGIGHVLKAYKQFGDDWISHSNSETQGYIQKYNN